MKRPDMKRSKPNADARKPPVLPKAKKKGK